MIVHPRSLLPGNIEVDKKTFDAYFEPPQHLNKARNIMYKIFPPFVMKAVATGEEEIVSGIEVMR